MEEKKTIDDRIEELKAWFGRKKEEANVWVGENKEIIILATPVVGGMAFDLLKTWIKASGTEEYGDGNYIVDWKKGHGYYLKKRSKHRRNKEFIEVDQRLAEGEELYDILKDKKMLK